MTLKLYRIECESFTVPFVVSTDPTRAYEIVREYLDIKDIAFSRNREFKSIEFLAECTSTVVMDHALFLDEQSIREHYACPNYQDVKCEVKATIPENHIL